MCHICSDVFCHGNPCSGPGGQFIAPFTKKPCGCAQQHLGHICSSQRCGCNQGCLHSVPTACINTIKAYPCLGIAAGADLNIVIQAIEDLCSTIPPDCCEDPQTYTIDAICNGDPPLTASTITITPNFTYNFPLTITVYVSRDGGVHWSVLPLILPVFGGVSAGVPLVIQPADVDPPYGSVDFSDLGDATIRIIDNQSNYSEAFQIANTIPTCT